MPLSGSNKWKDHTNVLTMNLTDDKLFTQTEASATCIRAMRLILTMNYI